MFSLVFIGELTTTMKAMHTSIDHYRPTGRILKSYNSLVCEIALW